MFSPWHFAERVFFDYSDADIKNYQCFMKLKTKCFLNYFYPGIILILEEIVFLNGCGKVLADDNLSRLVTKLKNGCRNIL